MGETRHYGWQFSVRELLMLTTIIAVLIASTQIFGWLNVLLIVLHPLSFLFYAAVFIERHMKKRRKAATSKSSRESAA